MTTLAALLPEGPDNIEDFLSDHASEHAFLAQALAQEGKPVPDYDLGGPVDADWLEQHALIHETIAQAISTTATEGLRDGWQDTDSFSVWSKLNYDQHAKFRQLLKA